jgi:hypothetical protein
LPACAAAACPIVFLAHCFLSFAAATTGITLNVPGVGVPVPLEAGIALARAVQQAGLLHGSPGSGGAAMQQAIEQQQQQQQHPQQWRRLFRKGPVDEAGRRAAIAGGISSAAAGIGALAADDAARAAAAPRAATAAAGKARRSKKAGDGKQLPALSCLSATKVWQLWTTQW